MRARCTLAVALFTSATSASSVAVSAWPPRSAVRDLGTGAVADERGDAGNVGSVIHEAMVLLRSA